MRAVPRYNPRMADSSVDTADADLRKTRVRFAIITAAAIVAMVVTASLGCWQLRRAADKEAYQAKLDARAAMPALEGHSLLAPMDANALAALVHRQVVLQGEWLADETVYLDNRQMQGRPGFYVVTPLRLTGAAQPGQPQTVLVQRGWVARNFADRNAVQAVTSAAGVVQVNGRIAGQPARLLELQTPAAGQGASRIRQNLDTYSFAKELGQPLSALTAVQTDAASDGLARDWPVVGSGVEKHYGYAFQWFGLCSLIAILYAWFQIVRRVLRRRSHPSSP
jgi:surfeit locus 1 family protein